MEIMSIEKLLSENAYPGRGIIIGKSPCSKFSVVAYFIMGRSENSRNRIFETTEDGIRTKAFDESKMTDPSLIIYHPVRTVGRGLIVTNGDQTDTVYDFICKGLSFQQALRTREFEPDAPNFTPRISGLLGPDGSYKMSILKSANSEGSACSRYVYEYAGESGFAHFIHTYKCDGDPIPSFEGEPTKIQTTSNIDDFTENLWNNLNEDNKVSLFVRYINLENGEVQTNIVNKNKA